MPKSKRDKRKRPPTVAEATRALEAAQRREAGAHIATRRVDLVNLDTPDVTHAEQYAEFLNRPGRFYVGQFEIPLDDEPLGQKLCTQTTFKADDQQLLYLVEVLRQIRGALSAHARITLTLAQPAGKPGSAWFSDDQLAESALQTAREGARVTTTTPDGVTRIHRMAREVVRQRSTDDCNIRGKSSTPDVAIREWCCGTPITAPHVDGCMFKPRPDAPIDYTGPARVATPEELAAVREMRARAEARNGFTLPPANGKAEIPDGPPQLYGRDWVAYGQEFTREELVDMLPGQTRAEVAQELGKEPEEIGGTVHNADVMPEELAAELGVPVESLQRIAIQGGGYAWAVKPTSTEQTAGRHAAPDEPQS
uniref:Helix-turn-helix DNA binding domain protein n=1 Tax=Mycobacterium phage JustASigh TaxID=3158894 RepID=A0AAU8GMY0_9CAUD